MSEREFPVNFVPFCGSYFRAREIYNEGGLVAMLSMGFRKLISPAVQVGSVYFLECDLRAGLPKVRPVAGIIAREAFRADIDLLDGTENAGARKADAIERFRKGDRWFVGIEPATGKLTNYRWVTTSHELIPELGRHLCPAAGDAFVYALYTVPEYRRRGIDSFTRHHTYNVLHHTYGITRVIATIFDDNHVSMKASRHFLKKISRVWYVTFRGCRPRLIMRSNSKMPRLALHFS